MNNKQIEELIKTLDDIEGNISAKDIYVGFNGHGHLRYIQATRAGLIKLGVFFIKSAFSVAKYIDIDSEEETLEWVDPESEETIDYIEIVDDIEDTIKSRNRLRMVPTSKRWWQIWK